MANDHGPTDWGGLIIAALVLVIVLIVSNMCIRLFKARRPARWCGEANEKFSAWAQYRPACSGEWSGDRTSCKGLTTGDMPSVEEDIHISWAPCGGALGVPPPVYQ